MRWHKCEVWPDAKRDFPRDKTKCLCRCRVWDGRVEYHTLLSSIIDEYNMWKDNDENPFDIHNVYEVTHWVPIDEIEEELSKERADAMG